MPFVDHRKNSRANWGKEVDREANPDFEDIKLGCMLRIADATEAMAKNHVALQAERDRLAKRCDSLQAEVDRLRRKRAALRGVVSRLKRRLSGPRNGGEG